jgi:hypothetical protein
MNVNLKQVDSQGNAEIMNPATTTENITFSSSHANIPAGIDDLDELIAELGALAFEDGITIPNAGTDTFGVVKLKPTYNDSTDTTSALSVAGATALNAGVVHNTGDETIAGVKNFSDGIIIAGIKFNPIRNQDGSITLNLESVDS